MQSPCINKAKDACFHGCCATPFLSLPHPPNSKSNTARHEFAAATVSSLFPNTQFTNPESLPSLQESFSQFIIAYPSYTQTNQSDQIRAREYYHLSDYVCLDYLGNGLFSYSQKDNAQNSVAAIASSSSSAPPPPATSHNLEYPFFDICYKSASLQSHIIYGGKESELESSIRKRIMSFLNISETDYSMVFTANRSSAFKLLAESYPFKSNKRLLTTYDYESEAVTSMINSSQKRGAKVMSAEFSWPNMRIHSAKLTKMVVTGRKKKRKRGLFVFPLQSRMTGARYPYLWMSVAQENGWHVLLDACAFGPKDMDTLGLSLFRPDFLICSFFKIFGENPSGFGCLFVKKSIASILECSTTARSIGIVNIVPAKRVTQLMDESSSTEFETQQRTKLGLQEGNLPIVSSFSGPISSSQTNSELGERSLSLTRSHKNDEPEGGGGTEGRARQKEEPLVSEIIELETSKGSTSKEMGTREVHKMFVTECRSLDHADSIGLIQISYRARCLINWLVNALLKLQHPHSDNGLPLVRIYGPKIKLERGAAVSFNIFDWKGEKVEPVLVQKLADRSNISLSYGFLQNIWFSDTYEEEKERVLEKRTANEEAGMLGRKGKEKIELGITVVTAALGFLSNFEDIYRLLAFVAKFLDADFVEKERWRYVALNQSIVEV